jgi:hypothetical protein
MFLCSGLLIASKHKTKVFSDFVEFEEYGTFPWDCVGKYYKFEPSMYIVHLFYLCRTIR